MSVAFLRGQQLGRNDMDIFLANNSGHPVNAAEISYAIYDFTTGLEVLVGSPNRTPVNPSVGEYYASIIIPLDANLGGYRLRWKMRETAGGPIQTVVQEFEVLDRITTCPTEFTMTESALIHSLRILTRDNNPDKNYHFRPPTHEDTIRQFNKVFGYIWEDEELNEYIARSLDMIVAAPPRTPFSNVDQMVQARPEWRTILLTGAMIFALQALQINWVAEEFSLKGDTLVRVLLPSGVEVDLTIEDLYEACKYEGAPRTIKEAFEAGTLRVVSVDPATRLVTHSIISDVQKHHTKHKNMVRTVLVDGRVVVTTVDHSLFCVFGDGITSVEAGKLKSGDFIVTVQSGTSVEVEVASVEILPPEEYTYDLSVPGPENFMISNGILAHNSYSIGGVSLDIDKASKYEAAKNNAQEQFDKQLEKAKQTVKITKGLQQPKYGTGVRSSFGPSVGRGVLSPRKFMGL